MAERLAEVTRNGLVESSHNGDIAVVDENGSLVFHAGDPKHLTYFRSTCKPIITVAVLQEGVAEEYGLDLKEIAVIASSHSGEKEHLEVLEGLLKKTGIEKGSLMCGEVEPTGKAAAKELAASGLAPEKLHCNCSGKHIGVIAAAKKMGFEHEGYISSNHSVQLYIEKVISDFCGMGSEKMQSGIDGCGITVYAVPLQKMALSYANLCNHTFMGGHYSGSQKMVREAMINYPEMVAGRGRLDTELVSNFGDRVFGKFGAEGVYCAGVPKKKLGIAIKIEDGSSRAVGPVIIETLLQSGILSRTEAGRLIEFWRPAVLDNNKKTVGEIRPVFSLQQ